MNYECFIRKRKLLRVKLQKCDRKIFHDKLFSLSQLVTFLTSYSKFQTRLKRKKRDEKKTEMELILKLCVGAFFSLEYFIMKRNVLTYVMICMNICDGSKKSQNSSFSQFYFVSVTVSDTQMFSFCFGMYYFEYLLLFNKLFIYLKNFKFVYTYLKFFVKTCNQKINEKI